MTHIDAKLIIDYRIRSTHTERAAAKSAAGIRTPITKATKRLLYCTSAFFVSAVPVMADQLGPFVGPFPLCGSSNLTGWPPSDSNRSEAGTTLQREADHA